MTPNEIKAALILKDLSMTDIAEKSGSSVAEVSRCIAGDGLYLRIREVIAGQLGKKVKDVFGDDHPQPKVAWCRVT